jgi:hypothetical protein
MITVVITANRSSPIVSFLAFGCDGVPGRSADLAGEPLGELLEDFKALGRHLRTASTEALQG